MDAISPPLKWWAYSAFFALGFVAASGLALVGGMLCPTGPWHRPVFLISGGVGCAWACIMIGLSLRARERHYRYKRIREIMENSPWHRAGG